MSCSKEEIERKRLAALQRRSSHYNTSSPQKPFPSTTCSPSTSSYGQANRFTTKSNTNNGHKTFHPYAKPTPVQKEVSVPVDKVISGIIYLVSEDRFEVNPSEFCTPLIDIFKSLPSKNYDPRTKLWNFSLDDYQELMAKVAPLAPHVVLGSIPASVLKMLKEPTIDPTTVDLSPVEATLRNKLMPFQEEGVRFGIAKRGRCMIADDMGLGKTFQALGIASYYKHNWPLLVVTTSSMRETWQSKIHELLPSVPMMNIVSLTTSRDAQLVADRQTEVVVCSYKLVSSHTQLLKSKKFGVVVIDESHYLKSHRAQCTLAISALARTAARVVLLSGTPALSRPQELYTQLQLIQPGFLVYNEYGKRYCAGRLATFGWDMSGQSNLAELNILLQKRFLIRRTKDQVLTALESKTRESVMLDATLLDFSQEDKQGLSEMAAAYTASRSTNKHNMLLGFFSESARAKTPAVCKYIKQLIDEDATPKFLVFAHHRHMLDAICLTLDELGTHYICITGATPATARAELVDKFQHSPTSRAAVLSVTACGAGVTLTAATLVIFAELHWNPGILTQAESRAHRIGQQGGVCVRYLLAAGTVDDHIWPMLQNKLNVLNEVGLSKDTFENNTTKLQASKNNIQQYLSPTIKNQNDYIPGTNIRKDSLYCDKTDNDKSRHVGNAENLDTTDLGVIGDEFEKSFLDDDGDDALLADLDL